jgi:hypothetical protein
MNSEFLRMSRRTFLGGTLATVVDCSAHGLAVARPMNVVVVASSQVSAEELESVTKLPEFNVLAVVSEENKRQTLPKQQSMIPMSAKDPDLASGQGLIVLGNWRSTKMLPRTVLDRMYAIYVDDPDVALGLIESSGGKPFKARSMVGFDILTDPNYEFAYERVRRALLGRVTRVAVTSRKSNRLAAGEVAAAIFRLDSLAPGTQTLWLGTRAGRPCIHVCFEKGQIAIPLHSPDERREGLPIRLRQFADLTRGEDNRAISLNELNSCMDGL